MNPGQRLALESHLKTLRLPSVKREYARTAKDAARESVSHENYLLDLLNLEMAEREARAFAKRLREARLPANKTLAEFEFAVMPNLDPMRVHRLASCEFVSEAENVLFVGPSGTGKTHLATAIAVEACRRKRDVRFFTVSQLVEALLEARTERTLGRMRTVLKKVPLLVLDELGFVPLPACGAELLFEIVSDRYEKASIVLTTNLPFEEWISVLASEPLTHAMLDRLTHHVHILEMNGRSYRLAQSLKRNVTIQEAGNASA
jgi:DNA replication protein DnaC